MRYQLIMSAGAPITIEYDEIEKILQATNLKGFAVCRQGIINPAHLVSIIGKADEWEGSNIPILQRSEPKPLKDLFSELRQKLLK